MISPIFYADDGVLGPDLAACRQRLKKHIHRARGIVHFERQYSVQLKAAAAHLDRWCAASRMHFGEAKTKVVVFNRGKRRDDTCFDDIRLCGYTVGVTDRYDYLGLTLSNDLKWGKHAERKVSKAREVARRLTSVAINARPVQPAVIRELVRTCLVPSYDYGIEYWGIELPDAAARQLQAATAKPLRVACGLPLTAHQLSTLRGAGISPVATHTQHKQLQHLQRVSRLLHEDSEHPTAQLYTQLQHYETDRRQMLDATVTSPIPVYLVHAVLPFVLDADRPAELALPTRQSERRKEAHRRASRTARRLAARAEPRRRRHEDGWEALIAMARPPLLAAPDGAPNDHRARRRAISEEAAHLEWTASHEAAPPAEAAASATATDKPGSISPSASAADALASLATQTTPTQPNAEVSIRRPPVQDSRPPDRDSLPPILETRPADDSVENSEDQRGRPLIHSPRPTRSRTTTAPLTGCLYEPGGGGGGPPLRFLHSRYAKHTRHKRLVGRMRLLYGRSYTATVRARFPTDAAAAAASTLCPHTACAAAGTDETIEHLLLHCPLYAAPRATLAAALDSHGQPLSLRTLLNPPTLANTQHSLGLFELTDAFLGAVTRTRRDRQLPNLDGCPHYGPAAPPASPADTARRTRPGRTDPAGPGTQPFSSPAPSLQCVLRPSAPKACVPCPALPLDTG
jgi:hypothetical protein